MKTYKEVLAMKQQVEVRYDAMLEEARGRAFVESVTLEDIFATPLESSSMVTPEYKAVVRKAKSRLAKILKNTGWRVLPRQSMPHFEYSVQLAHTNGKFAHFFTGDLRGGGLGWWVVRETISPTDWGGLYNRNVKNEKELVQQLENIAK